jgi:hypothetical protein
MRQLALAILFVFVAARAAAEPQFVTLERADRESRVGVQTSLQVYPDLDDIYGLRTELYGQLAGQLRGGGVAGGYGRIALGFLFGKDDSESGVSNVELGGYYIAALGVRTDLVGHLGLSLPTASDGIGGRVTNAITSLERNYDLYNSLDETTLNLGVTLRTGLGAGGFLQADLALDLPVAGEHDLDPAVHVNLGLGAYVGNAALLGELATIFSDGDLLGSLALGIRFAGAAHPHVAYVMAFRNGDDFTGEGIIAHMLSVGLYAAF